MNSQEKSIRPFIGAKNFEISRKFYRDWGFEETRINPQLSVFKMGNTAFYLQNAHVKDWVDNTMLFLEVEDLDVYRDHLVHLKLTEKYPTVRLLPIREEAWGRECFLHDPSGILWHIGVFR